MDSTKALWCHKTQFWTFSAQNGRLSASGLSESCGRSISRSPGTVLLPSPGIGCGLQRQHMKDRKANQLSPQHGSMILLGIAVLGPHQERLMTMKVPWLERSESGSNLKVNPKVSPEEIGKLVARCCKTVSVVLYRAYSVCQCLSLSVTSCLIKMNPWDQNLDS